MSGSRRARLPGADELFRSTGSESAPPGDADPTPSTAAPSADDLDRRGLATLLDAVLDEDEVHAAVRGEQGPAAPPATLGSVLAFLTAQAHAKQVVHVGRGGALLGLWVLRSLEGGVLTSITGDRDEHAVARSAFDAHGGRDRVRAILGQPHEVVPRLSDGAYDLLIWGGSVDRPAEVAQHAARLLGEGGVVVVTDLAREGTADARGRRELVQALSEAGWQVAVVPADGGYALARRT